MRIVLAVILMLSGLMALGLSVFCLVNYPAAIAALKLAHSESLQQCTGLFAAVLIPAGVFQIIAAYWVFTSRWGGLLLARCCGMLLIITGVIITFYIHRPDLGAADLVKGILILVVSLVVRKNDRSILE